MNRRIVEVGWDEEQNRLICKLPLTTPTGKVRVKRNDQPIATRQIALEPNDLVEWQIAYRDHYGNPIELGLLLLLGYQQSLFLRDELTLLRQSVERQEVFWEEVASVTIETTSNEFAGFRLLWRKHPVLVQSADGASVRIEVRHRQRGVGFQAMVYVFVPLRNCLPRDLVGRPARPREQAIWSPPVSLIVTLVRAFAIGSRSHKNDMVTLLTGILDEFS
ncbi:MAG: R.Pab1 family restriction endonuclease [Armatimonadetes bacterium]|nr:R.Pab1 family restriction endonuclease [Armatimonadota bacterium]MDW8121917.1 R.Pab1 family restriction endonuclease [Armatimonadota bacterium]